MTIETDKKLTDKFESYPDHVRPKILALRNLIVNVASEEEGIEKMVETLKWGEPSFLVKGGSTIRIDWKDRSPSSYALYFNCQTTLVETFRHLYNVQLKFEGNRAIILDIEEEPVWSALRHCIFLALCYHKLKHLTLLGA